MLAQTNIKGKWFTFLEKPTFQTKKGKATFVGAKSVGDDTLIMLTYYDTGEREDILISTIEKLCIQKGIKIKKLSNNLEREL